MCDNRNGNGLGLVSNCWKQQLDAGATLVSLIGQAVDDGFRFVELRQGCLGECEDAETRVPDADALASLARNFSQVTFDLAVELPVFSQPIDASSKPVGAYLLAARSLSAGNRPAHLRIVDLVSREVPGRRSASCGESPDFSREDTIQSLHKLNNELPSGIVSVEHSFQPWSGFRKLFDVVRSGNDELSRALQICYDPCNLWLTTDGEHANDITEALPAEWLSMVHLKQRVGNEVLTTLKSGDVDWRRQLVSLSRAGYRGPFYFEIAPSDNVWQCLADSRRYLAELLEAVPPASH
ncbi:MAG: sugar phosphate isomerase/epimerase [Rhodopirellula sp.]|nr:sugar phosphate isomerase/epimerase [Rhodopirellula sp.]